MTRTRRIYVASSWRNSYQQEIVSELRRQMHAVYDFKNPPGDTGFAWSKISPNWQEWSTNAFKTALETSVAVAGYRSDFEAMQWADTCVLVLPSGRSSHLEAAYMAGQEKDVFVYMPEPVEPELMYLLLGKPKQHIAVSTYELHKMLEGAREE